MGMAEFSHAGFININKDVSKTFRSSHEASDIMSGFIGIVYLAWRPAVKIEQMLRCM